MAALMNLIHIACLNDIGASPEAAFFPSVENPHEAQIFWLPITLRFRSEEKFRSIALWVFIVHAMSCLNRIRSEIMPEVTSAYHANKP